jgi:hypothetical protein
MQRTGFIDLVVEVFKAAAFAAYSNFDEITARKVAGRGRKTKKTPHSQGVTEIRSPTEDG